MESRAFPGCRLAAAVTIIAALAIEVTASMTGGTAPHAVLLPVAASPVGMSAVVLFFLMATPAERTIVVRLTIAVVVVAFAAVFALGFSASEAGLAAGACIPGTVVAYLLVRIARTKENERAAAIDLLAAAVIIPACALTMIFLLNLSVKYFNPIFDAEYIRIDELFGAQPSAVVAALFEKVPLLIWPCATIYFFIPVAQAAIAALEARTPRPSPRLGILPSFIISVVIGYVFYALIPAIGPLEYFGREFPMMHVSADYLASRGSIDLDPGHIRGAMPSLHITWAVLLYLASRRMHPYVRWSMAAFLLLTFLATLGLGMHYLIDLIVAVPLIVLVRALAAIDLPWRRPERSLSVGVGILLLAAWVVITRAGIDIEAERVLIGAAIAVTVILPLILSIWLDRAQSRYEVDHAEFGLGRAYSQMPSLTQ